MKLSSMITVVALLSATAAHAANLSPGLWPADRRAMLETEEQQQSPSAPQAIEGDAGIVSATFNPIAVYAGVEALRQGGSAADAAATIALTQISTRLQSSISYAGLFTMVYYDARTHKVYSLDAGYNSYRNELEPTTIPVGDLGSIGGGLLKPTVGGAKGRETLVPGFMAGLEAMHRRFGRLPFKELFAPALWYDEHGILTSKTIQSSFDGQSKFLKRTPEGRAFLAQAGGDSPKEGALFIQSELAKTLRAVSEQGARYMYTGQWAKDFVRIVQREGGKVTLEDLSCYQPTWSDPYEDTVFGYKVYVNGPPTFAAHSLLTGLNLAEALHLDRQGPYWTDVSTFQSLGRINDVVLDAPVLNAQVVSFLKKHDIGVSPADQLTKSYAARVAPLLDDMYTVPAKAGPNHSNSIAVIDKDGNIAALTHTSYDPYWGDTGIVVDGIPIPAAANDQQARLAALKPGDRVPHEIPDAIVLSGEQPVLATASIGSSLGAESLRVLLGVLGQHQDLKTLMAEPAMLERLYFDNVILDEPPTSHSIPLPRDAYSSAFLDQLRERKVNFVEVGPEGGRGILAAVAISPSTGRRSAVNQPGLHVLSAAQ